MAEVPTLIVMSDLFDVDIRDDTIKLGQFVKLANLAETGGEAKEIISSGRVLVNGIVDTRRGKTLRNGDVVSVQGRSARVCANAVGDDFFDEATADDDFDYEKWRNM